MSEILATSLPRFSAASTLMSESRSSHHLARSSGGVISARPTRTVVLALAMISFAGVAMARQPAPPEPTPAPAPAPGPAAPIPTETPAPVVPAPARPGLKKEQPSAAGMVGRDQTITDLQDAHAVATSVIAQSERFAKQADDEGQGQVASLFRAVKRSSEVRQRTLAAVLQKLNATEKKADAAPASQAKTADNIKALIQTIDQEKDKQIPLYVSRVKTEMNRDVTQALRYTRDALREQSALLGEARDNPGQFKAGAKEYYVSRTCGFMVDKLDFKKCPVCLAARDDFELIK
jgi:rubrerythrin